MEEATARYVEIGRAYQTLNDDKRRAQYDAALRGSRGHDFGSNVAPKTYESYRDAFDEAVTGLSEADLTTTLGVIVIAGGLAGCVVGSRLGDSRIAGRLLGSLVGCVLASRMAGVAFVSLYQESIARVAYKNECQRCVEQNLPMPESSPTGKWRQVLKKAATTVKEHIVRTLLGRSSRRC